MGCSKCGSGSDMHKLAAALTVGWHTCIQNSTFGWDSDGIRGHVFANTDDSLLIISFKGTSAGLFTGGPTGDKDKQNVSHCIGESEQVINVLVVRITCSFLVVVDVLVEHGMPIVIVLLATRTNATQNVQERH